MKLHRSTRLAAISISIVAVLAFLVASNRIAAAQDPAPSAQAQPAPAAGGDPTGRSISIDVEVTDKAGHNIHGLQAGDFTLLDNKQPKRLLSFQAFDSKSTPANPVHVVIVVDMINSDFTVVSREREQLGEFLKEDNGRLSHPASVAVLADSGLKLQNGSTNDGNELLASFDKSQSELRIVGRAEGFYGATERLEASLSQLSQLAAYESTLPGRKMILFISPGWPMIAWAGIDADLNERAWVFNSIVRLSNGLRQGHIALYAVNPLELGGSNPFFYQNYLKAVPDVKHAEYADLSLQVLAVHTGGLVQVRGMDIAGELNNAMRDANSYYTLTFESAPSDDPGDYHGLLVQVDKPDVTVRTTTGYYTRTPPQNTPLPRSKAH